MEEFRAEIGWFLHNCEITSQRSTSITAAANNLALYVDEDILSICKCLNCYKNASENPKSSFTQACDPPHLLIWAKMGHFDFWPAKAMSAENEKVHVWFFGDHTTGDVNFKKCYLYSEENPDHVDSASNSKDSPELIKSLKVCKCNDIVHLL